MPANIIFSEHIPAINGISDAVVDTNIFIDILNGRSSYQQKAEDLLNNLVSNGVNMYITQTIQSELMDVIQRVYTQDMAIANKINIDNYNYKGNQGFKRLQKDLGKCCPNYFHTVATNRDLAMSHILSMVDVLETPSDYHSKVLTLQREINGCVEITDTGIIVTAFEYGINTIATGDYGYSMVDGINVIPIKKGDYELHKSSNIAIPFRDKA